MRSNKTTLQRIALWASTGTIAILALSVAGCATTCHKSVRMSEYDETPQARRATQPDDSGEYEMVFPGEMVSPGEMVPPDDPE